MSHHDSTYNGWTNKPTWLVHLWLTNDYSLYHTTREVLVHAADRKVALRDFVEEVYEVETISGSAGLISDLLGWALRPGSARRGRASRGGWTRPRHPLVGPSLLLNDVARGAAGRRITDHRRAQVRHG